MILGFFVLMALLFLSLPVVLVLLSVFVISGVLRRLFLGRRLKQDAQHRSDSGRNDASWHDPNITSVIRNEKIGPYRIKKNPRDPTVIEVLD